MRFLIAGTLVLTSIPPAGAAPPSSCAGKFIGEWRHSGSGNRGSIMADGRALCSEHPACTQGTWTCSGNVLTYTNSLGTWDYTLAPDGKSMSSNGGAAVATRIGSAPASARSRDLGTAANVTADILGIDRTPSAAPPPAPPPAAPKPPATPPSAVDGEKRAAANYAHTLYGAGEAALNSARDFTMRTGSGSCRSRRTISSRRQSNTARPVTPQERQRQDVPSRWFARPTPRRQSGRLVPIPSRKFRAPSRPRRIVSGSRTSTSRSLS